MRFNPPPNWPVPRSGWNPPKGWLPDPTWPPAPPGWAYWIHDAPAQPTQDARPGQPAHSQTTPVRDAASTGAPRFRAAAIAFAHTVNPARIGYALMAAAGATLFVWMFVAIRFSEQWNYGGWMWRGLWPVIAMMAGLGLVLFGASGTWRWGSARWVKVRDGNRRPTSHAK